MKCSRRAPDFAIRQVIIFVFAAITLAAPPVRSDGSGPRIHVTQFDGQVFDLSAHRGHIVIVHFYATWCSLCRSEMPVIDAFYRQNHASGVDAIALSVDDPHDRDKARKLASSNFFPAAMASDATVSGLRIPDILPVTYIFDADGVLRATFRNGKPATTPASLAQSIGPLPPTPSRAR